MPPWNERRRLQVADGDSLAVVDTAVEHRNILLVLVRFVSSSWDFYLIHEGGGCSETVLVVRLSGPVSRTEVEDDATWLFLAVVDT